MKKVIKKLLREGLLKEDATGKHLIVVDIQPEYKSSFGNMSEELAEYINENYQNLDGLTFFYNGYDTLGMIEENEYRNWWYEQGLNEDIAFNVSMYDKGYAFFRFCIDSGIEDQSIVNLVKHMINHDVNDSRELDEEFWSSFIEVYGDEDVRELLEFSDDCLNIPDLMDELRGLSNIVLTGGGVNECLKEVEIALDALDKQYTVWGRFTY